MEGRDKKVLELPKWECLRCGHKWVPRREVYPRICPKCKSPYWDRERERKEEEPKEG